MSIEYRNINGNWKCQDHNIEISIVHDLDNSNLFIVYHDSEYSKYGTEFAKLQKSQDLYKVSCRLGMFTILFDGNDILIFRSFDLKSISYTFKRVNTH